MTPRRSRADLAAGAIGVTLALFVTLAPSYRYHRAGTIVDLPIFVESLEHAIRGEGLRNSTHAVHYLPLDRAAIAEEPLVHLFADHFNPVLYLLLPLYRFVPGPDTLFAVTGLLVGSSAWPVYRLALTALGEAGPAVAVAGLWALYPSVLATSWHFLPGVFTLPLLAWAIWAEVAGRRRTMLIWLALALGCNETAALPVLSFAAWLAGWRGRPRAGAGIAIVASLWLVACVGWIIPANAPVGEYPRNVYAPLGPTVPAAIRTVTRYPGRAIPYLADPESARYLGGLLAPLALLPLGRADLWLLGAPVLAQNLFAGRPGEPAPFRWPAGQWSASLAPFTFLALIGALALLRDRFGRRALWAAIGAAGAATAWCVPPALSHPNSLWRDRAMQHAIREVRARVPAGDRISSDAPDLMLRDFGRWRVCQFPAGLAHADWALVFHGAQPGPEGPDGPEHWRDAVRRDPGLRPVWSADDPARDGRLVLYRRVRKSPEAGGRGAPRPARPRPARPSTRATPP